MIKTLIPHGNAYALVIDKPMLDSLEIGPDTPLEIATDGKSLTIAPADAGDDIDDKKFQEVLDKINHRYARVLKRLAE